MSSDQNTESKLYIIKILIYNTTLLFLIVKNISLVFLILSIIANIISSAVNKTIAALEIGITKAYTMIM
jgi:hypothetical protein